MESKAEEWKWKVESAADTLAKGQEIKDDKKLYAAALKELRKRQGALTKLIGQFAKATRGRRERQRA